MRHYELFFMTVSIIFFCPVGFGWNQNNLLVQKIQNTKIPFQLSTKDEKLLKSVPIEELKTYRYYTNLLLQENTGLLYKIVNSFRASSIDLKEELFQEACIEYLNAIKTFDTNKNVAFNTYAYLIVRRKLASFLLQYENAGIRTPKHLEQKYYQFLKNKKNSFNKIEKIYGEDKTKIMNRIGKCSPLFVSGSSFRQSNVDISINIEDSENYLDDYFQENEEKEWLDRHAEILKIKKC